MEKKKGLEDLIDENYWVVGIQYQDFSKEQWLICTLSVVGAVWSFSALGIIAAGGLSEGCENNSAETKNVRTNFSLLTMLQMDNISEQVDLLIEEKVKIVTFGEF